MFPTWREHGSQMVIDNKKECEDCGDFEYKLFRCKHCHLDVCCWCYQHVHQCWPNHTVNDCRDVDSPTLTPTVASEEVDHNE